MQRRDEKVNKNKNEKIKEEIQLTIKITAILLVFGGLVALTSLLYLLSAPKLSVQVILDIFALSVFPIAYGIWMRKKWAFYAALILLEAFIIIYPLIAAFSPYFGIEYNWVCLLSFVVVGISVVPILVSKESYFNEALKGAKLQSVIEKLPVFNLLFVIFGVALIIRTVLPYDTVFKDTVRFASDDAVFHMRLVENALFGDHFPRRLFFDAYTYFPHGSWLHFAPLFDEIIIFATWIIGLGSPTKALMESVGAYYPAILGALAVFPVYIIGKEICNKYAGLIAAVLVATLPGQFLSRSIIGFTDHHVGEALFSTIAVMFLVLALKRAKEQLSEVDILSRFTKSPADWVRNRNFPFLCYAGAILLLFQVIPWEWWVFLSFILFLLALIIFTFWKKPDSYVFYTVLAGMALGFYLLTWVGGLFFVLIFFLFGVIQYTLNGLRGEPNDYICIVLLPTFFISLLMLLPFFGPSYPFYNIQHVGSLSVGIITFAIPLLYRYLINKFGYRHGVVSEKIAEAKDAAKTQQKIGKGEYICPICGKKSRTAGIIEHIKTKHRSDIESKSNLVKIKLFFDKNPELSAGTGLKKLGIGSMHGYSPLEKITKYDFLLPVFIIVVFLGLSAVFFPSIIGSFGTFTPGGTALTIAEVHPMDSGTAWRWFTTPFFVSFFAMAILAMNIVRRNRPEELLMLVWSIIIFVAVGGLGFFGIEGIGQNRFAYYYAVNAALLTGLFSVFAFEFLTGIEGTKTSPADVRSKKKGGKVERSELDIRLLIFAFAIMIIFVVGIAKVGIESIIPLTVIVAIFFFWMHASNTKREDIEKPLTKTLAVLFIIFIVFYPFPLNAVAKPFPSSSNLPLSTAYAINTAKGGIGAEENWYEALRWMRDNTPDPGVDYYGVYEEPPLNETTGAREDYKYPPSAYGVMSWWDYGHIITWIAHRIPNANPFQAGIGGPIGSDNPGACVFFILNDESEANKVADALGVRYVVSDFMMADVWNALYNKYSAMTVWAGDPQHYNALSYYYNTMEARLHIFDGTSVDIDGKSISALEHYRLVHESPTFILPLIVMDMDARPMYWRHFSGDYKTTESQAQILHGHLFSMPVGMGIEEVLDKGIIPEMLRNAFNSTGIPLSAESTVMKGGEDRWTIMDEKNENVFIIEKKEGTLNVYIYGVRTGQPNMKAWTPEYIQPVSFVKVFEYVKGARIEGTAPNGSIVEISTTVNITNRGREFVYSARKMSNGTYEFIAPYSTEGPVAGGTNFDVFASPYKIRAGHVENETVVWDLEKEISVPEEAVMEGKTIRMDV